MTREEAILYLQPIADNASLPRYAEALNMAIAALREQSRPEASNQQVTEPLQRNGSSGSEEAAASKNQVKGIRLMARPWQPQDLLDDLQLMIDEEPDSYLNDRRTTLCMARGFLKEHFAESGWISAKDRPPEDEHRVLVKVPEILGSPHVDTDRFVKGRWVRWGEKVTHWKPLQEEEPTHDEA